MIRDLLHRLGGLVTLALGLAASWWGIVTPLEAARAQAPEVHYDIKLFVLAPLLLIFGLFFLLVGDRVPYRNAEERKLTTVGWILMTVVAVAAFGSYFLLKQQFATLGYQ
ncbi:MAG TPA: hypothetical protein VN018_09370 [Brevundimonas sp.]|nr:hypothetical protein [Brevundimonas sp.]